MDIQYDSLVRPHSNKQERDEKRTQSVAVGSQDYVERIKKQLGALAPGRTTRQTDETIYRLQESHISYNGLFRSEKDDMGGENSNIWDIFD